MNKRSQRSSFEMDPRHNHHHHNENSSESPRTNFYDVPEDHPLCLCEYVNKHGQRAHLLMCCCDCEAFDTLCTNLCCGEEGSESESRFRLFLEFLSDISDRFRVPCPGGARQFDVDFFLGALILLVYVLVGTISLVFSVLVLLFVPVLVYARFFTARLKSKSASTRIAFFLLLNALSLAFLVFNFSLVYELDNVIDSNERLFINFLVLSAIFGLVYLKFSNPGFITSHNRSMPSTISTEDKCTKCNIRRDAFQSGHCPICQSCVYRRDHHCFWVDNCIGYMNHKKFVAYLVLLLVLCAFSFNIILRRLRSLPCKLNAFWYAPGQSIPDNESFSCLFDVFYSNFARSALFLLFIQLVPIIGYLVMLLAQQACFISLGLTQNQLFKISQTNVRFSLALFISSNFKIKSAFLNWFNFLTKCRRLSDFLYSDHLV